ncbi:MAG TPA: two-component regulator propeller domain-containing protein [Candidatus Sulfotelmatobacter sp.]|nr:two-component regulator propeller domain-containing protein [Candidatus Sulfotelmatobacter sp.]
MMTVRPSRFCFPFAMGRVLLCLLLLRAAMTVGASDDFLSYRPIIGQNANGQLEVFRLDDDGCLCHKWRKASNGAWSLWCSLDGSLWPGLAVVNDTAGKMEMFGVDRSTGNLEQIQQLADNGPDWSSWHNLGGRFEPSVAAERNAAGQIDVFAVDAVTHCAKHIGQTVNGSWSSWMDLGGSLEPAIAAAKNQDGRLELFGLAAGDGELLHCWQLHPNTTNDWSPWASLGGAITPGFTVERNMAGELEVFAVNETNSAVERICEAKSSDSTNWTAWQDFGTNARPGLASGQSADRRIEIFAVRPSDSELLHKWELFTNTSDKWSAWTSMNEKAGAAPAVGVNEDGDLEVYVTSPENNHVIDYRRQISGASGWLDWSSLDQPVFSYAMHSWQADDGLPDNVVQAITQTADGFLWVGTRQGLARFDGDQFVCYDARNTPSLKNSSITALCAGKDGSLWIGTDGGGLVRLRNGVFSEFATTNGLAGDEIRVLYQSADDSLWIGTTAGMSRYKNGRFRTYTTRNGLLSDIVRCIYEDQDKNLWVGTGKGLNRLRPTGKMDSFVMPNGLPNNSVRVICQDHGGRIWVGSNNGLLWYDWFWGIDFYAYNTRYGLSDTFVSAICEDGDGNLWVGTYSGLNRFRDGRFYHQPDSDGQPFDQVNTLFTDREGNLWVGSREGLARLTAEKFFTYTKEQGLTHNNIMSVLDDARGSIWIGTWGGGLDELRGEKITGCTPASTNVSQDLVLSLCLGHDGSLWIGADYDGGLTRIKDGKTTHYTWRDGLINGGLRVLCEDTRGNLWAGTDHGVSCFKDGKFVANDATQSMTNESVRDICEDGSGALWFALQNCVARWQDGQLTRFTAADGLPDSGFTALYADDDNTLWIGTAGSGLYRYRNGRFTGYTSRQGLFSDEIFGILDDDGWLWMSSSKGIFRVRKRDVDAFENGKIESIVCLAYGKNDGMETPQCNGEGKPSIWKSRDGRLWFPTSKGLAVVNPKTIKIDEEPPSVFIETVTADEKVIEDGRMELAGAASVLSRRASALVIPPGRRELEFKYAAIGFSAPEKERFKYRMDPVDSTWTDAGIRRVAYYNNLSPGHYRFEVKACNKDGVWNEAGAFLDVVVVPRYWEMFWFRALMALTVILAAGGMAVYAVRRRMQRKLTLLEQQHAIERERGRIARDMHDQIGAGLTQIGLLGEIARRASNKNGDSMSHVDRICDTARELAQTLDEMVWMVNPRNDTLNKLALYLAAYAEEFFKATTVRCLLDIPSGLPSWPLPAEVRHNLFLTAKEAFNNIAKHSHASEARVKISLDDSMLKICIEDDGVGFSVDGAAPSRNGLSNMKDRVREIGGAFDISSEPRKGTRICLRVRILSPKITRVEE